MEYSVNDYLKVSVPKKGREDFWQIVFVWVGYVVVVGVMAVGGGLASQYTLADIMIGILVGNVILGIFAMFSGYVGAKSGKTFYQLSEEVFGSNSARVIGLYVPVVLISWYAIESSILGGFIGKVLGLGELGQSFLMSVVALVMGITAYKGFLAVKNISVVFVPVIFVLATYALLSSEFSFSDIEFGNVSLVEVKHVVSIVVGTWIMGVLTNLPDVTRFSKNNFSGVLAGLVGILIGNTFNLLIGAFVWYLTGQSDPSEILIALGFVPLALLLAITNIWTTNDSNMYSATLNMARFFRIDRQKAVVIGVLIGSVYAFFNPAQLDFIFSFLFAVSVTAPALGGVVLGGYLLKRNSNFSSMEVSSVWIGLISGCVVTYAIGGIAGIVAGFSVAILVSALITKPNLLSLQNTEK